MGNSGPLQIKCLTNKENNRAGYFWEYCKAHNERFQSVFATTPEFVNESQRYFDKVLTSEYRLTCLIYIFFEENPTISKDYEVFVEWAKRRLAA